jgi:hypothetical protein
MAPLSLSFSLGGRQQKPCVFLNFSASVAFFFLFFFSLPQIFLALLS